MIFELKFYAVSALVVAAVWSLPAASMSLIYGVLRYPNFAIPEYMTVGAYLALAVAALGVPFWPAAAIAMVLTGLIAAAWDQAVFRRIRRAGPLPAILASLGLMLVLQNLVRFFFGNDNRQFDVPLARPFNVGGFIITPNQLICLGVAVAVIAALYALLKWTAFGRGVRAAAGNPELALVSGLRLEVTYTGVVFVAGALAAAGGIILALETALSPLLGWRVLIPVFAVTILGGLGSIGGAAVAAVLLAIVSELSLFALPVTYKSALAFVVLALVLIVKPTGLGRGGLSG